MGRLQDGAAFLLDHNTSRQIGVVESAEIGADRKGRAVIRFGRSALAEEAFNDIQDGIRKHISVGYFIHALKLVETRNKGERGETSIYRVTDWEPFEISSVSVPADPSVGVGRGMEEGQTENQKEAVNMDPTEVAGKTEERSAPVAPPVNVDAIRTEARTAELERVRGIQKLGDKHKCPVLAQRFIDEGRSVDDFTKAVLDELEKRDGGPTTPGIGMSARDIEQYSFLKVIRALADPTNRHAQETARFEFECSRAAEQIAGRQSEKGIMIPYDVLRAPLQAGNPAAGGYTVDTTLMTSSFVELLRNNSIGLSHARVLSGLVGNLDIPAQASGSTTYWVDEDEDVGETEVAFRNITLSPKNIGAFSEITRALLMQSSLDVEALVRSDLAIAIGLGIDKKLFYGTGATGKQPLGIANQTGINATTFAGSFPTYREIVEMETNIAMDNAAVPNMAYIFNASMRGALKTTEKFPGTTGRTIWEEGNTVNGYQAFVTNQIDEGHVFFGNFRDLIVGMWGGIEMLVDPYTHGLKGRLRIVVMQSVDTAVRHVESFCLGKKV